VLKKRRLALGMVDRHWVVFWLDIPCDLGRTHITALTCLFRLALRSGVHCVHSMAINLITCNRQTCFWMYFVDVLT
jgi:hypothetical protein